MRPSIDALFAEIEQTDSRATYVVLADALVEAGDPRGEMMQVQLALDDGPPEDHELPPHLRALPRPDPLERLERIDKAKVRELRGRRRELREPRVKALVGSVEEGQYKDVELEFRYGLLDRVRLRVGSSLPVVADGDAPSVAGILATIFASPEARMLRTVDLMPSSQTPVIRPLADWLVARGVVAPPSLRSLQLGDESLSHEYQFHEFEGEAYEDDLTTLLDAFPSVHELWIDLGTRKITLSPMVSDHLRHITFATPDVRVEQLEAFARSTLPRLQSFVVWTGASYYVNERDDIADASAAWRAEEGARCHPPDQLEPLLARLDGCADLCHLGVLNHAGDVAALATAIGKHPLAARLTKLDFSHADVVDADALAAALTAFPVLRELVVESVKITRADQRKLEAGTRVLTGGHPMWDDQQRHRYVITQE